MTIRFHTIHLKTSAAILLTLSTNCALLNPQNDLLEKDPIAQAALSSQPITTLEEEQIVEDRKQIQAEEIQRGLTSGDVVVGMQMNDVLALWGQPREIQTAGNNSSRNQKWIYLDRISPQGSLSAARSIYFEEGKVVGWDHSL